MKVYCKYCLPLEGIEVPEFTQSDKKRLSDMKRESPIGTVKCLMEDYGLSHQKSKYITTHINKIYGKCNRCKFDKLSQEFTSCPNCGALNFNWMINES